MSLTPPGRSPLPKSPILLLVKLLGFGTLSVDIKDQSRVRKMNILESSPAEISLLLVGVNSRAVGVLLCSCSVPKCLLLVEDLTLATEEVEGGETEEERV